MKPSIAVSSCCFESNDLERICQIALQYRIPAVELSGNIRYQEPDIIVDTIEKYQKEGMQFFVHNYFPPPRESFVLNLAHPDAVDVSRRHVSDSLELCHRLGLQQYSIHAGMAFSPRASDLGHDQSQFVPLSLDESRINLRSEYGRLGQQAKDLGLYLALENNVVASYNAPAGYNDRYHFADPAEARFFCDIFDFPGLAVLIDFAHLKVSANTIGFEPKEFLSPIRDRIRVVHISDNNGLADQNLPVSEDSWFWAEIPWDQLDYVSLEVYNQQPDLLQEQVALVEQKMDEAAEESAQKESE